MESDFFVSVDRGVIAIAIVIGTVLVFNQIGRIWRSSHLHRTVRDALNSSSPLAPELVAKVDEKPTFKGDARTGLVLLAMAAALLVSGIIQGGLDQLRGFAAVAVFPAAVGAVLYGRAWYAARKGLDS
jgi:hypothetical protein